MRPNHGVSWWGWVYLVLFALLLMGGIMIKRVYAHPEWVSAFHLPAAVFLVLAGYELTAAAREKYRQACAAWDEDISESQL